LKGDQPHNRQARQGSRGASTRASPVRGVWRPVRRWPHGKRPAPQRCPWTRHPPLLVSPRRRARAGVSGPSSGIWGSVSRRRCRYPRPHEDRWSNMPPERPGDATPPRAHCQRDAQECLRVPSSSLAGVSRIFIDAVIAQMALLDKAGGVPVHAPDRAAATLRPSERGGWRWWRGRCAVSGGRRPRCEPSGCGVGWGHPRSPKGGGTRCLVTQGLTGRSAPSHAGLADPRGKRWNVGCLSWSPHFWSAMATPGFSTQTGSMTARGGRGRIRPSWPSKPSGSSAIRRCGGGSTATSRTILSTHDRLAAGDGAGARAAPPRTARRQDGRMSLADAAYQQARPRRLRDLKPRTTPP